MDSLQLEIFEFELEKGIRYGLVYDPLTEKVDMEKRCGCGCGEKVKHSYVSGHNPQIITEEFCINVSNGVKKSYTGSAGEILRLKRGNDIKNMWLDSDWRENRLNNMRKNEKWRFGEEQNKKMISGFKKWMGNLSEKEKEELYCRISFTKSKKMNITRVKMSESKLKLWASLSQEEKDRRLFRWWSGWGKLPNSYEKRIISICNDYNFSFKYVGNGKFYIAGLNPDFVDINNNLIIEVYNSWWHYSNYETERYKLFKSNGYTTLFLNEDDICRTDWKSFVLDKINMFLKSPNGILPRDNYKLGKQRFDEGMKQKYTCRENQCNVTIIGLGEEESA